MDIAWEGFYNARDLGGLPTQDGGRTRPGMYLRSADPRFVTEAGWRAARRAGVRTVVDLRNPGEAELLAVPGIRREHIALDDIDDRDFWQQVGDLNCCPLYYPAFLERKAERCAAAITVLARARPGVMFHCRGGRDRTGLIAILLLALAGVTRQAIMEDYLRSTAALGPFFARLREPDQRPLIDAVLARARTTSVRPSKRRSTGSTPSATCSGRASTRPTWRRCALACTKNGSPTVRRSSRSDLVLRADGETDLAHVGRSDLDVGDPVRGHDELAPLVVGEAEQAFAGLQSVGDQRFDLLGRLATGHHQLTRGVLDADLDLHV